MARGEATGRRGVADFLFLEEIHHHLSFDMPIYLATLRVILYVKMLQKLAIFAQAINSLLQPSTISRIDSKFVSLSTVRISLMLPKHSLNEKDLH